MDSMLTNPWAIVKLEKVVTNNLSQSLSKGATLTQHLGEWLASVCRKFVYSKLRLTAASDQSNCFSLLHYIPLWMNFAWLTAINPPTNQKNTFFPSIWCSLWGHLPVSGMHDWGVRNAYNSYYQQPLAILEVRKYLFFQNDQWLPASCQTVSKPVWLGPKFAERSITRLKIVFYLIVYKSLTVL